MKKSKLSGPAMFMYTVMAFMALLCTACFVVYYFGFYENSVILWIGIVSFMILYHFSVRIFMGMVTKLFKLDYNHVFYKQRSFEKRLYKLLGVKKWKRKVLTFEPEKYDVNSRTLNEIATTMCKSELDHWINEVISVLSILFALLWGCLPAFLITAVAAMLFDAQFIVVQRYNRPIVLRLIGKRDMIKTVKA